MSTGMTVPWYTAAKAIECGEELFADYAYDRVDAEVCQASVRFLQ